MHDTAFPSARSYAASIIECIRHNRLDEADTLLEQMNEAWPETRTLLIFPVMIAIQRGQLHQAWQWVNGLPDGTYPHLKALCLRRLNDPSWHAYAEAGRDHANPYVRRAMRNLLGCSEADDIHALQR
jgi:type III secretion protein HrpB1